MCNDVICACEITTCTVSLHENIINIIYHLCSVGTCNIPWYDTILASANKCVCEQTCVVPAVVPDPIVTFKVVDVPPTSELVVVPPKVALHEAAASCAVVMKLVPNTVIVSPM